MLEFQYMALAAPNRDVVEDVKRELEDAPGNTLDQDELIEQVSEHDKTVVLSAVKDLMRTGEVSYTKDWKLVLER